MNTVRVSKEEKAARRPGSRVAQQKDRAVCIHISFLKQLINPTTENFHTHIPGWQKSTAVPWVHTCACHFLQKPPAPLKVGTPLSALTPAPVMMAICFALANTSRKSAMSVCGAKRWTLVQTVAFLHKISNNAAKRACRKGICMHPELASTNTHHDFNFRILFFFFFPSCFCMLEFEGQFLEIFKNNVWANQEDNTYSTMGIYSIWKTRCLKLKP